MAAFFTVSGRRLLSTAAAVTGNTELLVPIAHLRSLARAGRLDDIDAALAPLLPSHSVAAISALSSVGLPERASSLLSTIPSPTAAHLNALLGPLLRRRRLAALVPSLLEAHPSAPRDAFTTSIHAKALCLTSGADSALHLLQAESRPSVQLYTSLIDSYYKQRKPQRAEELWHAMVNDHGIAPDVAAHNVRINYKSTTGTVEDVQELIRSMSEEAGLRPDVASYNALLRALARHGRVDGVLEIYRILQKEGAEGRTAAKSAPDCATYTCVVAALCEAGRWSEAQDVFYEGLKRRKVSDLGTVRALVRGLMEADLGRAAKRVVVELRKRFPDQFDGPWRELEEAAGVTPLIGKNDEEGEEDEQQQATV